MICPHCEKDTPATERYCAHCGLPLDLAYDLVADSFAEEVEKRARAQTELRCRGYLFFALALLVVVAAVRLILSPAAPDLRATPPYIVRDAELESRPPAEPLPIERVQLAVPR